MVGALSRELELRSDNWKSEYFETIYFGGGTPSVLTEAQLKRLIQQIQRFYTVSEQVEITLECNPDDCTPEKLSRWKELGVTRLSIGIQSFDDEQLCWMNRGHTAAESRNAVLNAKKVGFDELSLDLIYGLPNLSLDDWKTQIREITALDPEHISAYCLTVENKTALSKWVAEGKILISNVDQQSEQFELLVSELKKMGYEQYEISNFARDEHYSKHNTSYWKGVKYLGIGPSAHGYNQVERYWNKANNRVYISELEKGQLPETVEVLSNQDCFNETLMIGLRTKWGVSKKDLFAMIYPESEWFQIVKNYEQRKILVETADSFLLTEAGRLLADTVAADLFLIK
jgi:oxygen-independent coproporphyrinogen-3 oxidase